MLIRLCALLFCLPVWGMELYSWSPHVGQPPMVVGVRDGESPVQAAERYIQGITSNGPRYKNLSPFLARLKKPLQIPFRNFAKLGDKDFKTRVLLIANRPEDLLAKDWRVPTFAKPFSEIKMPPYLVPFAADADLNDKDKAELIRLLNTKFPRFVGMGGDDVSGVHFGDGDEGSVDFNADRDAFEIALFAKKIRLIQSADPGDHRIWATCRAEQLVGRLLGQKIFSHIDGHGGSGEGALSFRETNVEPIHKVNILPTKHNLLSRMVGEQEFDVNSYHHKFSVGKPGQRGGYLEMSAISPDGVPEAYESIDARIFLTQFHAELMRDRSVGKVRETGDRIFKGAAKFLLYGASCEGDLVH